MNLTVNPFEVAVIRATSHRRANPAYVAWRARLDAMDAANERRWNVDRDRYWAVRNLVSKLRRREPATFVTYEPRVLVGYRYSSGNAVPNDGYELWFVSEAREAVQQGRLRVADGVSVH